MFKFIHDAFQPVVHAAQALALSLADKHCAPRRLQVAPGEFVPAGMPWRGIVLVRDAGEDWSVAFRCPCGCGRTIELLVVPEGAPRWDLKIGSLGEPTLHPSVWLKDGCRSHFWLRGGRVHWAE